MTRVPQGGLSPARNPRLQQQRLEAYTPMGITAENVARKYGISREAQDQFAVSSQQKAAEAAQAAAFDQEIIPINLPVVARSPTMAACARPLPWVAWRRSSPPLPRMAPSRPALRRL